MLRSYKKACSSPERNLNNILRSHNETQSLAARGSVHISSQSRNPGMYAVCRPGRGRFRSQAGTPENYAAIPSASAAAAVSLTPAALSMLCTKTP